MVWKIKAIFNNFGVWVMIAGLICFLATPLMLKWFNADTDVWGAMIFIFGLILAIIIAIVKKKKKT